LLEVKGRGSFQLLLDSSAIVFLSFLI